MKDIVIIANFVAEFDGGANSRFTYLANLLHINSKIEIIGSDYSHGNKRHRKIETSRFPYKVTLLHEPGYKKNICLRRFKSHKIWGGNVYKYLLKRSKPDVIYCAVPSLTAAAKAADYCNKNNVKFIIDIQDLWPEAFQMVFNIPVISSIIFFPFKCLANRIYKSADEIVAVSQTYVDRALLVNKKCKQGHAIFLGTKLETFDQNVKDNVYSKQEDQIWIGYCGTLGSSYDLTNVIDAIAILKNCFDIKLIIMGDGPKRLEFEEYAKKRMVVANFTGRLDYGEMCGLLSVCDIAVNPIKKGSSGSVINKVCDYAMAGLPVINTQENLEYRNLLEQYKAGINCSCEDSFSIAEAIRILIQDSELRKKMSKNSRKLGIEKFDRSFSYKEISSII